MGKKKDKAHKKDKASKSKKKKHIPESMEQPLYEDSGYTEPDSENIQVAEYVTVGEMMDLINTLNQELEQRAKASEQLQQQMTRNQNSVRGQYKILKAITIILVIGVIAVGYNTVKISSRVQQHVDSVSTDMGRLTSRIESMNASIQSINSDIDSMSNGLGKMSADISRMNRDIDKLSKEVNTINANTAGKANETQYRGYPTDPRYRWR